MIAATYLFSMANVSKGLALSATEEWEVTHHCVSGMLFVTFAVEAMINHFGAEKIEGWNSHQDDRKSMHREVFKAYGMKDYLGGKNYQAIEACFKLRDSIVHGKTVNEEFEINIPFDMSDSALVSHILSIPSDAVESIDLKKFILWIDVAKKIQDDFYSSIGDDASISQSLPLDVTGISSWHRI